MNIKKRGLGRGLDALLGAVRHVEESAVDELAPPLNGEPPRYLPLDLIQRSRFQPRRDFDPESLRELAESIAAHGVLQPVVVRPIDSGRYELIAGERRWRACQLAGLDEVPVVIREASDQESMAMGLIENLQRDDLNPLEAASALHRLVGEFTLTHQQVAQAVGKSRASVTNMLRLLDLNEDVKTMIEQGSLEMGHARALLGLQGRAQSEAARKVAEHGLSVRETERLVRRLQLTAESSQKTRGRQGMDPNVLHLQESLSERLGARVDIQHGTKGAGKLVINYHSLEELEGILEHIR